MTIAEVIRQQTFSIRDVLSNLDRDIAKAVGERDATNDRVKRCGTEITRQRALEGERKKSLNDASEKVAEAQRVLEELERRRQEALEHLLRRQEEHNSVAQSLREAQSSTDVALAEIRREQKTGQDAETRAARLGAERTDKQLALKQAVLHALDIHLRLQTEQLQTAFNTQEQQADAMRAFEDFKKARHADPEIGRLCEQREEVQKFLNSAMVPGVRDMLQVSLKSIEDQLVRKFPGALTHPPPVKDNQIDDLLFYCNQEGKAVFLLPIDQAAWNAATTDDSTEGASKAMCLVWHFLREMKLRTEDGEFVMQRGRPTFKSRFDLEDVAILQGFSVKHHESVVMRFILSAVPTELQEALSHEDPNI